MFRRCRGLSREVRHGALSWHRLARLRGMRQSQRSMTISERDLRTMLRLVSDPDDDDVAAPMSRSLLHGLKELIACDSIVVTQLDTLRGGEVVFGQCFPDDDEDTDPSRGAELEQMFWRHY